MNYVIWGAGAWGQKAFHFLGPLRVRGFIDNKVEGTLLDRPIYRIEEYLNNQSNTDDIVVIAAQNAASEMEAVLLKNKIIKYFIFDYADDCNIKYYLPFSIVYRKRVDWDYTSILSRYDLNQAKRVSIYGINKFLPYLISEIKFQTSDAEVCIIESEKLNEVNLMDCKTIKFEEAYESSDYILINSKTEDDDIRYQIMERGMEYGKFIDIFNIDKFEPSFHYDKLKELHNAYKGKRIFLIGNGPSLKPEDLDVLAKNNEISIACNRIYKIFAQTIWRPTILTVSDADFIGRFGKEIDEVDSLKIVADHYHRNYNCSQSLKVFSFIHLIDEPYGTNHPQISSDICEGVFWGFTVIYEIALHLAIYMGASEVILLGVDMDNYAQHFCEDYLDGEALQSLVLDKMIKMEKHFIPFETAKLYSEQHNISIKNATRGGALEIFERVDFDALFN